MTITKTAALKIAAKHISLVACGHQYQVYSPYNWDDLDGPNTAGPSHDYSAARAVRAALVAYLALYLLGHQGENLGWTLRDARDDGIGSARELVDFALRTQA